MGEEHNVERIVKWIALGRELSAIDIHHITDRFESVERNTKGQYDIKHRRHNPYPEDREQTS